MSFLLYCRSAVVFTATLLAAFSLLAVKSINAVIATGTVNPAALEQPITPSSQDSSTTTLFLPLFRSADGFIRNASIWSHAQAPQPHEVVLFRHSFNLSEPLSQSELHIFADTRYEAWLDGVWIGRGPARFSPTLQEYDIHPLADLQSGDHVIAVLVQWAPNYRRSESRFPHLKSHIQGVSPTGLRFVAYTGAGWLALRSPAWREDAVPVHAWGLVGPSELLDLRILDPQWTQKTYTPAGWSDAVVLEDHAPPAVNDAANISFQPRSIPILANHPITPTMIDLGWLSPGYAQGELFPSVSGPGTFVFTATQPAVIKIESLFDSSPPAGILRLDGADLVWSKWGDQRPDVYSSQAPVPAGRHNLIYHGTDPLGLALNLSTQEIDLSNVSLQQGVHAGRRLLLAQPVSDPGFTGDGPVESLQLTSPPAYAVLDLGRTIHGRLHLTVSGPSGTILDIGWDERLLQNSLRPLPYPGSLHPQWNQVDSWILDGSPRAISTLDTRSGRYILIAAWGAGPVQIDAIRVYEERYPASLVGAFNSSNPALVRVWQVGVETLYPNMNDAYTDTPWRERGQWWGDAFVEERVNRVVFGDDLLLRRGLLFMANAFLETPSPGLAPSHNGTRMIDYSMLWVANQSEYLGRNQDKQLLSATYPALLQFMAYLQAFENPQTGLLDLPEAAWSLTAYIETLGYHSRYGQSTALNALYYHTLKDAAAIALLAGDLSLSVTWSQKAVAVRDNTNALLYLPSQHRYQTNIYSGAAYPPTPHAQAWALAYGLVPENETDAVASSLLELLSPDPSAANLEIYGMFWVLEGLGRAGRISDAISIIDSYYGRLLDLGATTWWERFNAGSSYRATLSHGWGGAPTWFLTTYLLGAQSAGQAGWMVKPAFDGVTYASGSLPVEGGELQIYWERSMPEETTACRQGYLEIQAGETSPGVVVIPFAPPGLTLEQNGQIIWQAESPRSNQVSYQPDGLHVRVPGGKHTFNFKLDCNSEINGRLDSP